MIKKINFGKIDFLGNGRKNCPVEVEIRLEEKSNGEIVFTASGNIYNHLRSDIYCGGQCLDTIAKYIKKPLFKEIYRLWKLYHLNDMNAGTPKQTEAIKLWLQQGNNYDYNEVCEYLKSINLYSDNGYLYGTSWLYRPIPEDDLQKIYNILLRA